MGKNRETEGERRARLNSNRSRPGATDIAARYLTRDAHGEYVVKFPRHFGVKSKGPIKLRTLDRFPLVADAIAYGYVMHGLSVDSADRRYDMWQAIQGGFLKFLAQPLDEVEEGPEESLREVPAVGLGDLDQELLKQFKAWLDRPTSPGHAPSESTRRQRIQDIQLVLEQLMASKTWAPSLSPDLKLLVNPYPGYHREVEHTDILDDAALEQLYVAAAGDVEASMENVAANGAMLAEIIGTGIDLDDAGEDGFHCAAFMLDRFEEPFPPHSDLIRIKAAYERTIPGEAYAAMHALLYPDLDELLPFILLLSVMFAFNPGVVLNMTHDDYEEERLFGRERIRLKPYKPRAHRNQVNTVLATDDPDNPRTILRHLARRCARVRELVRPEFQDRVFLRFSRAANRGVAVEQSDDAMREAIGRFCAKHGMDPFTLNQIRPTTLDLVHEITGGNILAMQQVANHGDAGTTHEHYTSAAMQRRNEEQLAGAMEQLERKYRTAGKADVVERHRLRVDLGSATPGFICLDPKSGYMDGEKKGRLCGAYGRCPICPLAAVDPSSEHAFAYLLKLRKALDEAAGRLGAPWQDRWAIVKSKVLSAWIPLFTDPDVRRRGAEMAELTFPDLPKLD